MRNKQLLSNMAKALEPLLDKFVFVGGCTVDLLVDDIATSEIRITFDVDVIAEIATKVEYYKLIEQLKKLGFRETIPTDENPTPICRVEKEGLILDVMPTNEEILGFANKWYAQAITKARTMSLDGVKIKVISPAYFIATKIEAFKSRGNYDYFCHDMEDIVAVYNGCKNIVTEIQKADINVKEYISEEMGELVKDPSFKIDGLAGNLAGEDRKRVELVYNRIRESIE